ncbi:MAG: hypothetical protein IGS23_07440 [Rivularia sp. T60_A2020_040]|nr:hypothetical protein [Rivularia sp. T60_A2020_040]
MELQWGFKPQRNSYTFERWGIQPIFGRTLKSMMVAGLLTEQSAIVFEVSSKNLESTIIAVLLNLY